MARRKRRRRAIDPWARFDRAYQRMLPSVNLVLDAKVQPVEFEVPLPDKGPAHPTAPAIPGPGAGAGAGACSGAADEVRMLRCHTSADEVRMTEAAGGSGDRPGGRSEQTVVVRERPYIHAAENIRRWIAEGVLPACRPLPPVHSLAAKLGVDKNTITRAVRLLQEQGVVHRPARPGGPRGQRAFVTPAAAGSRGTGKIAGRNPMDRCDAVGGVMSNAMAIILSHLDASVPGYVLELCCGAGVHLVVLHPAHLDDGTIADLAARPPQAALIVGPDPIHAASLALAEALRAGGLEVPRQPPSKYRPAGESP